MLRVILKREILSSATESKMTYHYTMDINVPELEKELTRGGFGEMSYDYCSVVDIEVLPQQDN